MSDTTIVLILLGALGSVIFAVAAPLSQALVRSRARRLPTRIAGRMQEEWLGELNAIASRVGKLAFAIALFLTRRQAFAAPGEESMSVIKDTRFGPWSLFNSRKALLILPTVLFAIAAYGASFLLPVRYASEALIQVVPQSVSREFAGQFPEVPIKDPARHFEQLLMSRTSLLDIVRTFPQVLPEDLNMDRKVAELRKDISLEFLSSGTYFRVRYVGNQPETAQKVASKLTMDLIEESYSRRESWYRGTDEFLRGRLKVLAERVTEKGDELARERAARGPQSGRILAIDYDQLVATYKSTWAKLEDFEMTLALESQQRGANLMVVDAANLGTPVVPNRIGIAGLGALAGLAVGGMALLGVNRRQRPALA
jgi:uncharacterized protein involved in exopolysaccharide biosynthesis